MQTFTSHVVADDATSCSDFIITGPVEFSFVISVLHVPALQEMWITKERWLESIPCITRSTPNQI